ncbi:MAG: hypothetical protein K2J80_09675 [Oscillospiraceae bacterium]|nr:hypothetical protein [Oscillospiraceae bacterium]
MGAREFIDGLSETFLWEVVSAYIEQPRFLPEMLRDVGYLDNKEEMIRKVDSLEISDSEPLYILYCITENGRIVFGFEMPFVLIAKSGKEQLLRITATAAGKCSIPDKNAFDWSAFDWDDMNKQELLSHKELAEFLMLNFEDAECDDLSVI